MGYTAIFGGTFNPFHIGHYAMLSALNKDNSIDKILVMPDRIPPHKVCDYMAGDDTRIEMCRIISQDFQKAELCLIEFERQGRSYSYDTVLELKNRYPDDSFVFVCGGDMLVSFSKWYNYEKLMKLIPFIVFRRSDISSDKFNESVRKYTAMGMKITVKDEIIPAVSSTEIRNNFEGSKNLLPKKIYNYLSDRREYNG